MKVIAFGASSSKSSINRKLATYAAGLLSDADVEILDLNDFEMPLFSEDKEKELGHPELAHAFLNKIAESEAVIISFAEHNGSYSAAYKNLFDWCSRINPKVFQNKPVVMLATSPGPGGAGRVLAAATTSAPYFDADLKGSLSIPSFYDNFDVEAGCLNDSVLNNQLASVISSLM